jgi:tetratricopeptide (TPR) repeat protein
MRRWFARLAIVAALLAPTGLAAQGGDQLDLLESEVRSLLLEKARARLEKLEPESAGSPRGLFLRGRLAFYEGRFDEALEMLGAALAGARAEQGWRALRHRVEATRGELAKLERIEGDGDDFAFFVPAGGEKLLVPYAEQALAGQLDELEKVFDDRPQFPIGVVFLGDAEALAACSGLTSEQIQRTGTVAVSKYGRVMLLTPRALATGYPWLDTLSHELTHMMIARASLDRAPIWLHEGIAKLLEGRWRGQLAGELTPGEAYLLDRAARERRLIPLRRFHPSIAHLPNQEDAALAYSQVLSFVRYLDERLEDGWLRELLARLGRGESVGAALTELSRFSLERLYRWWRQTASGARQTPVPAVELMKRRYKRGATTVRDTEESVLSLEVRRHLRLGDLLRLRGHDRAASHEFGRALGLAESPSPAISDRLAGCLLDLGENERAAELLEEISELYPFHATALVQLGTARLRLDRPEQAAEALTRANAIHPFHPALHCLLADAHEWLGRREQSDTEKRRCRLLASERTGER